MKFAVLIIAHKNVQQLVRLIKALDDEDIDVFIHIDKKWHINQDEISLIENASLHVCIIQTRLSGFLDTWSLCQISIELIKEAMRKGEYGYFMLLSAQDYPIKSINYIKAFLRDNYPKPMIDCTPMRKDNWIYSGFKWIRFNRYYRAVERITHNRRVRKALLLPIYAVQVFVTFVMVSPYKRLRKLGCDLYGGSAWWILPLEVVKRCVNEVDANSDIVKAFKLKNTPEETFFQTMTMQTNLKDMVEVNDPYEVLQNSMTYAYFFDDEHIATGHPYILTAANFDMLAKRKELFARKFDTDVDSAILDLIDKQLLI